MGENEVTESRLTKLFDLFDKSSQPLDPREVDRAITNIASELVDCDDNLRLQINMERFAFSLVEKDSENDRSPYIQWKWKYEFEDPDGNRVFWPPLGDIDRKTIAYWRTRMGEVIQPYLKRRYAGLVWGLWKSTGTEHPGVEVARAFIDATLELSPSNTTEFKTILADYQIRALNVALSINDDSRVAITKRAIIDFEHLNSQDQYVGTWGKSFDSLVDRPKGMLATEEEAQEIVDALAARLERLTQSQSASSLWAAFWAGRRLGGYFYQRGDQAQLVWLIECLRTILLTETGEGDPYSAAKWSIDLQNLCGQWGLNEDESAFKQRYRHFSELSRHSLHPICTPTGFSQSDFDSAIKETLTGDFQTDLNTIAIRYTKRPKELEARLEMLSNEAPISHMIPRVQVAQDGRPQSAVGGVSHDKAGHLVALAAESINLSLVFLQTVVDAAFEHHQPQLIDLVAHFLGRPLFQHSDQDGLLERCLGSWFDGDYVVFAHLAVALIERAVRSLVNATDGDLWKPSRQGGMNVRLLNELLRDAGVMRVLGEDLCFHLQVVLTDPRGMNLRNEIAHGLLSFRRFGRLHAMVLFHALLILALVVEKTAEVLPHDSQGKYCDQ